MHQAGQREYISDQHRPLVLNYLIGNVPESAVENPLGGAFCVVDTLLADEGFRQQAMDAACSAYRELIKRDERQYWRYTLWDPDWETEYVNLLFRQGRKHPEAARHLAQVCGGLKGKRVLEVGCGFGRMACELALLGADVTAVEIAEDYLRIARLMAAARGLWPNRDLEFRQGAAETLPIRSGGFDIVWSDQTIEHVQDVSSTLKEMIRVLKPGGLLFVRCPNYLSLSMREPHFKTFWPPFQPRTVYRWILARDYDRRSRKLQLSNEERQRALAAALVNLYEETNHINFIKPYQVAMILNRQADFDWSFIRSIYKPACSWWKWPIKYLWYKAKLDVLLGNSIFLVGTKRASLTKQLNCSPIGLWPL
jgi:2-polyprenyl-3-methyl-5-hydroxy-6-metoxy-1,4-benzoquinol methylase